MENNDTNMLIAELRGWREMDGMSDDARRKLWLMRKAADEIDRLQEMVEEHERQSDDQLMDFLGRPD